jgi:hypothetical protein
VREVGADQAKAAGDHAHCGRQVTRRGHSAMLENAGRS